ncbi:dipeptide epimerase [Clostridium cochlearium]|uniref:Dipeptide epimerase n=1 Tax=Clostridium cochlearium TaxID=1494 RepID=A0A240AP20_CLOCO|nr:dipeptide epimerase [Clostridium cochlearium]MBE6064591.1 dipeptide epimerase [Clostridium cochlearium]NMA57565.1 dipeptide epimerase [Clostridium cochlearium]SNV84598.1 mandelate racemase/muconate lactonizing family protein [Clostridium cochlearium]SQB33884.1 mandelate racemase/muconate lactonizing family protein [Clostridium cochlearium]STA93212.1 mandelate racemase/muconate lactonizing family protein [Clostridium cochlearium]
MKITDIKLGRISVPLRTPFKTALRTVNSVEDIIVEIHTDTGNIGFGEAPPTGVITGDTTGAIIGAIEDHIKKTIIGMNVENFEEIMLKLNNCILKNTSAKAAVDIALYDLYGQLYNAPLYKLLGGYRNKIITDITISVNEPEEMAKDSIDAINRGYNTLKIKVGKDSKKDMERMKAIRKAVGYDVNLRIDANQGWRPKEAVKILRDMEDVGLQIEFVEQPVSAHDIDGLKFVTDNVAIPVLADESVFSPMDALNILQRRAADFVNIKLMKTGGIYNALKICSLAEIYGVECMIGCMLEAKVSVTAAVHLACAKNIITKIDLDGPVLCKEDPVKGGALFEEYMITLTDDPGLGIKSIENVKYI